MNRATQMWFIQRKLNFVFGWRRNDKRKMKSFPENPPFKQEECDRRFVLFATGEMTARRARWFKRQEYIN